MNAVGKLDDQLEEAVEIVKKEQEYMIKIAGDGLQTRYFLYEEVLKHEEFLQEAKEQSIPLAKEACENIESYQERLKAAAEEARKNGHDFNVEQLKDLNTDKLAAFVAGGGALAGGAAVAFGPSLAMLVAMNFGVAQGGAAIAGLGGVAATNAALAWLGGGTLAAGGAGMAGGQALLAMFGPIGWTIAGGAGITALVMKMKGNKKKKDGIAQCYSAVQQLMTISRIEETYVESAKELQRNLKNEEMPSLVKLMYLYQASFILNSRLQEMSEEAS